ncbi:MAG TPA: acyltransferase domain-containing protein [Archangium sp.]|uniref:acyltransferase domain-containing protein n=1 Tax=Archangium sp. TaxID=1872627 RepID=UPI002E3471D0|nr:acyltransferase domain-containing protein [Archangium sp.]HEX5748116.1 acyltransferase domain-containing protein [Archangium sp.]
MPVADDIAVESLRFRSAQGELVSSLAMTAVRAGAETFLGWLSAPERRRLEALPEQARRGAFLWEHVAAKAALMSATGGSVPTDFELERGAFGQPLPRGGGGHFDVSISHAAGQATALAHPRAVPMGLDVEVLGSPLEAGAVDASEQALVQRVLEADAAAARSIAWTMKAALGKALRTGRMTGFDALRLEKVERTGEGLTARYRSFPGFAATSWVDGDRVTSLAHPLTLWLESPPREQGRKTRQPSAGPGAPAAHLPPRPVVFMFSGQGSHYFHMGRELWRNDAVFRDVLERCDRRVRELTGSSVLAALYDERRTKSDALVDTHVTHPAIFLVEYALCEALRARGLEPDVLLGVSLGEFTCALVSGALDLERALTAVVEHARVITRCVPAGTMLAVLAPVSELEASPVLRAHVEIASVPFPQHAVVSLRSDSLPLVERELEARGLRYQPVMVSHPFHSSWIDGARADFLHVLRDISFEEPRLPTFSSALAGQVTRFDAEHFWQAARLPMRFRETCDAIRASAEPLFVDLGPSGTLSTYLKYGGGAPRHIAALTPFGQDLRTVGKVIETTAEFRQSAR